MKSNSTRARLLSVTAQLLQLKGYHGTGLSEILRLSETPKGSLYHYFPKGKDQLVIAALEKEGKALHEDLQFSVEGSMDLLDAMERMVDYFVSRLIESNFEKGCPIGTVALEISNTHPQIRDCCADIYEEWEEFVRSLARKNGFLEEKAERIAQAFMSRLEGALLMSKVRRSPEYLQVMLNEFPVMMSGA